MDKNNRRRTAAFLAGLGIGLFLGVGLALFYYLFNNGGTTIPELPSNQDHEIQLIIKESFIKQMISEEMQNDPLYSEMYLDLKPPNLALATLYPEFFGIKLPVTASIEVIVDNGEILVDILDIDIAGFNIPAQVIQQPLAAVENEMQEQIDGLISGTLANTNLKVIQVSADENNLYVEIGE
jgi:hypothetical protein